MRFSWRAQEEGLMFGIRLGKFKKNADTTKEGNVPRVVILGGGHGGVYAALELQKAARRGEIEFP